MIGPRRRAVVEPVRYFGREALALRGPPKPPKLFSRHRNCPNVGVAERGLDENLC